MDDDRRSAEERRTARRWLAAHDALEDARAADVPLEELFRLVEAEVEARAVHLALVRGDVWA